MIAIESTHPKALSSLAATFYRGEGSAVRRLTQTYRPYICPFGAVMAAVPAGAAVLDVGCGAGLFLLLLARQGRISRGHGFDVSAAAVRCAERASAQNGLEQVLTFEVRVPELGLPAGSWNVVTAIDVVHHVPRAHQEAFFVSLCDAVPTGGTLIIKDMVKSPRWRSFANGVHDLLLARELVNHVDMQTVCRWAETRGVIVNQTFRENTLWYGHWMAVFVKE
jgi:2-polyprenyl-3-methyl-5-hydroxy-6-metoxy-1,4-benzoquinol methylase